ERSGAPGPLASAVPVARSFPRGGTAQGRRRPAKSEQAASKQRARPEQNQSKNQSKKRKALDGDQR
ncbi:hypothetical protein, partial [Streptomyces decoyicus]